MTTLKKAKEQGKLEDFIAEHEKDAPGDKDKFDKTLDVISHPEKSRLTQETFVQDF
jgi:hypothetical protein